MSFEAVPDHYEALGLAKDCTSAQAKAAYRKLALKCHPDKVVDESKKAEAVDSFHKIQQAYEVLSDDARRAKYDASVKLARMREEILKRQQGRPKTQVPKAYAQPQSQPQTYQPPPTYNHVPPPSPKVHVEPPSAHASFTPRSPRPYGHARPAAANVADEYDEELLARRRQAPTGTREKERKTTTTRTEKEERMFKKEIEKMERHLNRRTTDKDRRRERETKHAPPTIEDDSDDYFAERARKARERAPSSREGQIMDYAEAYISMKRQGSLHPSEAENHDPVKRSSARRRERAAPTATRERPERPRYSSEPQVPAYTHVPRSARSPVDDRAHVHRARTFGAERSDGYEAPPSLKRAETMPASTSRRAESSTRTDGKMRPSTEMRNGLHTPGTSPPYEPYESVPKSATKSTMYEISDHGDMVREIDPYERSRRYCRSPSPIPEQEYEYRSRDSSRKARPKLASIRTDEPYYGSYSTPKSARYADYESAFGSRRGSLDPERDRYETHEARIYVEANVRSARRSRDMPPGLKRHNTFIGIITGR